VQQRWRQVAVGGGVRREVDLSGQIERCAAHLAQTALRLHKLAQQALPQHGHVVRQAKRRHAHHLGCRCLHLGHAEPHLREQQLRKLVQAAAEELGCSEAVRTRSA